MVEVEILQQKGHNFLWVDDYLWMWDIPVEQKVQKELADKAFGNLLVAGYGLGIVQRHLLKNPNVKSVITIEILPEVIDKCREIYGTLYGDVKVSDFFDYKSNKKFDVVIGDVWKDILPEAFEDYKKFKEKAMQLINTDGVVLAWGQEFFEYLIEKEKMKNG